MIFSILLLHRLMARLAIPALAAVAIVALAAPSRAQVARPARHTDDAFDLMNILADSGLHDIDEESWNAYGQSTWISSLKLPLHAPYSNFNGSNMSLSPDLEHSFSGTLTLFIGLRLWQGAGLYYVPEVVSERPLSNLRGLGGSIQNFEMQKGGSVTPQLYRARAYIQQVFGLGGGKEQLTSDPLQLGGAVDRRRLVLNVGNFTVLDFMDKNLFASDPRQLFFNMAFMTYSAFDFGSNARGLSLGAIAEIITDDFTLRLGRVSPPKNPNELSWELRLNEYFGDQIELEYRQTWFGLPGNVRLLAYHNRVNAGRFDHAVAAYQADSNKNAAACVRFNYGSSNPTAPDLCWVRQPTSKTGIGIAIEQQLAQTVGTSLRAMVSDGQSEVYAYTSTDRSLSAALLAKGDPWGRSRDMAGVGFAVNWISRNHARYLAMGGVDGFVGDGRLSQAPEWVAEGFYRVNVLNPLWLSADYQIIGNPAFNADRGPVQVLGGRAHAEF